MRSDRDDHESDDTAADRDDSAADRDGSSPPDCPRCGEPIAFLTVSGPMTGSVSPCGCSVPPALVHRED
ncbi:hypothetical protein [Natrinema altunense]|uniref:Small CPxCG-related zinc finger protein n=1 Tax=Natrinema altunense (strain JCM 12890 / CGMCC 1.3731 / AJ2) TaxID=1227494 RepID=L9ZL64_NATA2|nr:hypothetical protein [Natrinema altunense]ELY85913.1 hypothetical protein C485_11948 [Natrinema altunense JCM 12890]